VSESNTTRLRVGGFEFFGAITASLSHELNNVLATVNELGGLLGDLVAAAERGRPLDPARLKRALDRIPVQIKRGEGHVRQLNRFAHSVDHDHTGIELKPCIEELVGLCERFARLRKVSLEGCFPEHDVSLEASPFLLMHLIYRSIDFVLAGAPAGSTVRLGFEPLDQGARVTVSGDGEPVELDAVIRRGTMVQALAEAQGGAAQLVAEAGRPAQVILELPRRLKGAGQAMGEAG
jgi:signal transduction histidine kinase